jgi:hypothetical protein
MKLMLVAFVTAAIPSLGAAAAHALNEPTHILVNRAAAGTQAFGTLLQSQLGLLRGVEEPFQNRPAIDWIGAGGDAEDASNRFFRHFHDPLKTWQDAGLPLYDSSVHWMQRDDAVQGWSWQHTRRAFHAALVTANPTVRDEAWAAAFQGLGQVMHLVVDASVPEHTRGDPHPREGLCRMAGLRCYGNYEHWVSDQHATKLGRDLFISTYLTNPTSFDRSILQQPTADARAPVPIARLIDTDTYAGADPNVTLGAAIGIAEISNANFFSEDTADGSYPFPRIDRLEPVRLPARKTGRTRAYFQKGLGDGLRVAPALAECVLHQPSRLLGINQPTFEKCLDENVWAETAWHMLPRAVGYARGVLDYFFRGQLEVAPPSRVAYGLAAFQPGNAGAFTRLLLNVRNATPNEDAGPGEMTAVVRYRRPINNANLIDNPSAPIAEQLSFAVSRPVSITLTRSFQELAFDFSANPLPINSADLFLTVVFKGRLGLEDGAIVVGGKDLFEPDPIDSLNETDYDCFAGVAHDVASLPAYNPPAHIERDVNRDGVQDLFGPWIIHEQFIKTFDLAQPAPTPGPSVFDFRLPLQPYAQYGRVMVLQDQPSYGVAVLNSQVQEIPTGVVFSNLAGAFDMDGIVNDVAVEPDGQLVRRVYPSSAFRGRPIFHQVFLANPNMAPCLPQTPSLAPPVIRIDGVVAE